MAYLPSSARGFGRQDLIHKGGRSGAEPVMKSVVWTSVIPFAPGTCGFTGEAPLEGGFFLNGECQS